MSNNPDKKRENEIRNIENLLVNNNDEKKHKSTSRKENNKQKDQ